MFSVSSFFDAFYLQEVYDKICLVVTSLWFWHTVQWRNSDVIDYFTIFTMNEWMNECLYKAHENLHTRGAWS